MRLLVESDEAGGSACNATTAEPHEDECWYAMTATRNWLLGQLTLVRSALTENTLVSLPTGFGKTLVASVVGCPASIQAAGHNARA